jgi:hypothetical protein
MPDPGTPEPVPGLGTWMLDDYNEALDLRENDEKIIQVRKHAVAQRHCLMKTEDVPGLFDLTLPRQIVEFNVGPVVRTCDVMVIGGSAAEPNDRWVCVGDGIRPYQHPSNLVIRTQTWEYFSKYITCPPAWQGPTPA